MRPVSIARGNVFGFSRQGKGEILVRSEVNAVMVKDGATVLPDAQQDATHGLPR